MERDGKQVGEYRLTRLVTNKGKATVHEGLHVPLGRPVRIEAVPVASNSPLYTSLPQRAAMLAKLHHPAIAILMDYRIEDATHYFVSEYAGGVNLEEYLQTVRTPMPLPECLVLFNQILDGFAYLHRHDIVHGFVQPSLIVLLREGGVNIYGFGYLREPAEHSVLEALTFASQRNQYTPPETAAGIYDRAGDVYSLGMLLQGMLAGSLPGNKDGISTGNEVPDAIAAIIRKAASTNPKDRFPNAVAFQKALQLISTVPPSGNDQEYRSAIPESPPAKERKSIRPAARMEIPVLLMVLAVAAGFVLGMDRPEGFIHAGQKSGVTVRSNPDRVNGPDESVPVTIPENSVADAHPPPAGNTFESDSAGSGETSTEENAYIKAAARDQMESYYAALRQQDIETLMQFFNPPLSRFFNEKNVSAAQLRTFLRQAGRRTPKAQHKIMWNTMRYGKDQAGHHVIDYWMYYHYHRANRQGWQKQIVFTQVKLDENLKIVYMNGH